MEFYQVTPNSQNNLENKEQCWRSNIPDLKTYYNSLTIKTAQYCHKDRYIHQCNTIENPEVNPHI